MRRAQRRQRGVTLLELLIAVAVFAIFSAMAYGGLMRLLDTRERVDAERTFWRELATAFVRMERDFAYARNRPIRAHDGTPLPAFRGAPYDPRALAEPAVELTRAGFLLTDRAAGGLQRIGYQLIDDQLLRLAWPVLDRAPLTEPERVPVLRDVEAFEVRFLQPDGRWGDYWPPPGAAPNVGWKPPAVEITLTLAGRGEYRRVFVVGAQP